MAPKNPTSASQIADQKTITLLRLVITELGGVHGWSENVQWANIASALEAIDGKAVSGHAVRLRFGNLMKKLSDGTGEEAEGKTKAMKSTSGKKAKGKMGISGQGEDGEEGEDGEKEEEMSGRARSVSRESDVNSPVMKKKTSAKGTKKSAKTERGRSKRAVEVVDEDEDEDEDGNEGDEA